MFRTITTVIALGAGLFGATLSAVPSVHGTALLGQHATCCHMGKGHGCCGMCPQCCIKRSCTRLCCDLSQCSPAIPCCK